MEYLTVTERTCVHEERPAAFSELVGLHGGDLHVAALQLGVEVESLLAWLGRGEPKVRLDGTAPWLPLSLTTRGADATRRWLLG